MNKEAIVNHLYDINCALEDVKDIDLRLRIRTSVLGILESLDFERPHLINEKELLQYEAGDFVWGEKEDHSLYYLEFCEKPYESKDGSIKFFFYPNEAFKDDTAIYRLWSGMPTMEERKAVKWSGICTY